MADVFELDFEDILQVQEPQQLTRLLYNSTHTYVYMYIITAQ